MAATFELRCIAHDLAFESEDRNSRCPAGCSPKFVVQEFRTPPSIRHGGTRVHDVMQRQLAQDYNLTDMKNDKEGGSVMQHTRTESGGTRVVGNSKPQAYWNPGLFPVQRGWAQRGESAPVFSPSSAGLVDGGVPVKQIAAGARAHLAKATRFVGPKAKA